MKKIFICLLLIVSLFSISFSQQQLLDSPKIADKIKLYESWVNSQMDFYNLPGLSMGIVYDQELVWQKGFGYADLEKKIPMTPQTIFRVASITKLFTSTAIMRLRDAGKLRLDDPITKHLKWFQIKHRYPEAPEITIRHILTHTSGLPREAAFPYWTDHKFPTMEEIKEKLPKQETIFPSETKWKYSNLAMALLGEIVVSASGKDYETYITDHILKPLGMTNTSVFLTKEQKKNLATGYGIRLSDGTRETMSCIDSKGLTPAANISSNIIDLAKFVSMQFGESNNVTGSQILKANTLREMQRVHWLRPSWTSGWGLGFSIRKYKNRTLVGHAGWVGGNRSQLYFDVKDKIGVIVYSNGEDGSPTKFALKLFDSLVPEILNEKKPKAKPDKFNPVWEKFAGKYEDSSHWVEEVFIIDKKLFLRGYSYPPDENPESSLVQLFPEGKNTFRMSGENGNGETVIFQLDDLGNVKQIKKGENYLYPVK